MIKFIFGFQSAPDDKALELATLAVADTAWEKLIREQNPEAIQLGMSTIKEMEPGKEGVAAKAFVEKKTQLLVESFGERKLNKARVKVANILDELLQ